MHVLQRELKEKYLMVEDHCMGINMYKVSIWITYSALWSLWLILPYIYIKPYPLCGYVEKSLVKQFSIKIRIVCHISFEQFGWLLGWLVGLLLVLCLCVCWVCLVLFCKYWFERCKKPISYASSSGTTEQTCIHILL